jgi:hypothetical protein
VDKNTAESEIELVGMATRRMNMDATTSGTLGWQHPEQRLAGSAGTRRAMAPGDRGPAASQKSLSFWLLMVLYPFALALGTYPVFIFGVWVSAEYLFSLVCALVVVAESAAGRLKVAPANPYFLLGLALWLGANVGSLLVNPHLGTGSMVFRMLLKALFGYMVFWVLLANGRLSVMVKAYLAGCALCGLFSIAFCLETGGFEVLRGAAYGSEDRQVFDIDVFAGVARAGASNLLPVWICAVLYPSVAKPWKRAGLRALIVYFAVLAMLALRREVLVEAVVGLTVLWFAMPRKFRPGIAISGLVLGGVFIGTIALSASWQERLFNQTRDDFKAHADPRTVLLLNTPAELMEQPLLGHGPGSYPLRMTKYFPSGSVFAQKAGIAAHNSFSRAAVETGMIGLLGFALMVAALGWCAIRRISWAGRADSILRLTAIMIFLHVGDWLFFGDGIGQNTTWFFIGVLLYLDRCLLWEASRGMRPKLQVNLAVA